MSQPAPEFPPLPPSFSTMWSATPETPASSLPWLGPMCAYSAKPEVRALYMAEVGGSLLFIGSGVFVNVAILRLANEAAGCLEDADGSFQDCDLRLLGSRPSSIVAIIAAVVGLASAALAPYAGAVVDHTRHRRAFGAAMAALSLAAALSLIGIGPSSWFALTVCAISVGALAYNGHTLARWAYVRETVESEAELSTVVAAMRAWQICAQFAFLAAVVALSTALGLSDVQTARVAQAVSSAVALPLLAAAWWAFGERPAKHAVAPGQSLWAASVRELRRTLRELGRESPGLRKLLAVTALLSAPLLSFTGLSVSFLTQQLAVRDDQVALFAGLALISGLPGVLIYRLLSRRVGRRGCLLAATGWWCALIAAYAALLRSPSDQGLAIALALPTGMGLGWIGPAQTSWLTDLMPTGREAELWGLVTFAQISFSWVPPLPFAAINQLLGDMRLGIASLLVYFVAAAAIAATVTEASMLSGPLDERLAPTWPGDRLEQSPARAADAAVAVAIVNRSRRDGGDCG